MRKRGKTEEINGKYKSIKKADRITDLRIVREKEEEEEEENKDEEKWKKKGRKNKDKNEAKEEIKEDEVKKIKQK